MQMIEFLQRHWYWVATAAVSGGWLLWLMLRVNQADVTPAAATLMINREDALVLDVRETPEWNNGHIANARHIAAAQIDKHLVEIEKFKQTPVIVCCATGGRSAGVRDKLLKAGFEKVFNLAGGIGAWSAAGLPLTKKS